jgi:exosortase
LTATPPTNSVRWLFCVLWILATLIVFWRPLDAVIHFASQNDDASHIFLIPIISAGVIYIDRRAIFRRVSYDLTSAAFLVVVAATVGAMALWSQASWTLSQSLAAFTLGLVLAWTAGFALCFGKDATRAARFSLLLLLLAVPLPDFLLAHAVYFLQRGSAELATVFFDLTGVPFLRHGFIFDFGQFSVEIAEECSGIRSSIAVLILALLAAHFYLRSFWKQNIFILFSLFIMIVKNGVRIATLTLLSLYVNPSFLFGRLHHDGGVIFFLLGLALLVPILQILRRSEAPTDRNVSVCPPKCSATDRG